MTASFRRPPWLVAWRAIPAPVRRLMLGELLGLLAAASMQLTMAWWISSRGGVKDLATYAVFTALAALVATPLLSPAGDRLPKRLLIRLGKLCLVADAALLTVLCLADLYDLRLLCACGLLAVVATALLLPVEASILPELVDTAALPTAIRLRRGAQAVGGLLGPSLGGILLASTGLPATMAVNLLLCACAAGAAWWLGAPDRQAAAKPRRGWFADMADGLRAKWQVRLDRWWTLSGALMMACLLPATGLLVPLRIQGLGLSAGWFGACNAALSAGLLVGIGGVAPWLTARIGRVGAIAVALAVCAAAMAGTGLRDGGPWLVAMFALIGLCLSVTQLIGQTHRMLAMPEDYRARMNAANVLVAHLVASVAPAIAALLLRHMDIRSAYLLLSAVFAAGGVLMLAIPGLAAFLRQDHQSVHGWYGRQYPEAFTR